MFDRITRGQGKTALVQVCDERTILLVQVARMKSEQYPSSQVSRIVLKLVFCFAAFPNSLKAFIEDPTKIKLGVQIAGEIDRSDYDSCTRAVLT